MILVLASALTAEAKLALSEKEIVFCDNTTADDSVVKAIGFTLEPLSIDEMKAGDSKEISIKVTPENAIMPDINPLYDDSNTLIKVEKTSTGFKITALQESSNRQVQITFKAEGLEDQTLTIKKIVQQNTPPATIQENNYVVWINEVPNNKDKWKQSKEANNTINKMTIGGTGVDLKILNNDTPITAEVVSEQPQKVSIKSKEGNIYHLKAEQAGGNIKVTIKIDEQTKYTITIKQVVETTEQTGKSPTAKETSNQQRQSDDSQNKITQLHQRITSLKSDSTICHKALAELQLKYDGLEKTYEYEIENLKKRIKYAIIFSIIGTLIIAFVVLILLYKKLNKTFSDDLKDAEKETYGLRRQLNDKHSDKSIKEKRLKELEGEIDKFKKENDSLKMEIMHLQKNSSKVQSTTNQEIVENQPVIDNNPPTPEPPRIVSMYSDCIIDGYFNRVSERPDEDTVFELVLDDENMNMASVDVYQGAHRRIIANPAFIDGCEKQIVGNSNVRVERKGIAEKDADNGKWRLIKAPMIEIR